LGNYLKLSALCGLRRSSESCGSRRALADRLSW
jgi:hypothetical protein